MKVLTVTVALTFICGIFSSSKKGNNSTEDLFPYRECGDSFCFGMKGTPVTGNCVREKNCKAAVIVKIVESEIGVFRNYLQFQILLDNVGERGSSWVAVGISDDNKMGNDSVVECYTRGQTVGTLRNSMNLPKAKRNAFVEQKRVSGIEFVSSSFENGIVHCIWKLERYEKIIGQSRGETGDYDDTTKYTKYVNFVDNRYYFLLAYGLVLPGTPTLKKHIKSGSSPSPIRFDMLYTNCEQGKLITHMFCFGVNLGNKNARSCINDRKCHLLVVITSPGNFLKIQTRVMDIRSIVKKASAYVSVAFSFDAKKGNDSVTDCVYNGNGNHFVKDSFNKQQNNIDTDRNISFGRVPKVFDHVFECEWNRPFQAQQHGVDFNIFAASVYLMLSYGDYNSKNEKKGKPKQEWFTKESVQFRNLKQLTSSCNDERWVQCFGFSKNGDGNGQCLYAGSKCKVMLKAFPIEYGYKLELSGQFAKDSWIAVAFSDDEAMGNDVVFSCVSQGTTIKGELSFNTEEKQNIKAIAKEDEIMFGAAHSDGKRMSCKFIVDDEFTLITNDGSNVTLSFENTTNFVILMAFGKTSQSKKLKHTESVVMELPFVHVQGNISGFTSSSKKPKDPTKMLVYFAIAVGIVIVAIMVGLILCYVRACWSTTEESPPTPSRYVKSSHISKEDIQVVPSGESGNDSPFPPEVTKVGSDTTMPVKQDKLFNNPRLLQKALVKSNTHSKSQPIVSKTLFKRSRSKKK